MNSVLIGIDLGGTKIEIIALENKQNAQNNTLYRTRINTPKHPNLNTQYQQILTAIHSLVDDCETQLNLCDTPVGIGIPGALSLKTGLVKNANTVCLIGKDFKGDLTARLKRPVKIENDANCFALSEAMDGAGQKHNCVFAVILGTGVGGGFVINKRLLIGPNHIAGEWGHNALPWLDDSDQPKQTCYCGKHGCIETYLSGPGFSKQAKLQNELLLSSQEIYEQKDSNPQAKIAYGLYVRRLAKSLASVINIIDPDVIVLGGGLSNMKNLYTDVKDVWQEFVFSDEVNTQLIQNTHGDSSGVRGAAWLNKDH